MGQLNSYKEAMERLNASIAFKSSNVDMEDAVSPITFVLEAYSSHLDIKARLVETGAKKLAQLYTKLVAEVSSGPTPSPGAEWTMAPFPSSVLATLRQLVSFLRGLPLPTTHPSHPAAPVIQTALQDAQHGYADMRGSWAVKCLEGQGKRVIDRADTVDVIAAGKEFGKWVEVLLVVAEVRIR